MNRSIIISSVLHGLLILITAMSLPFLAKKPLDIPPIVSVELIQITEKTNIPFAPKAKKIIEKVKEKEKKLVSEQAPPKKVKKTKTKTVVSLDQNNEKIENQTPEAIPLPEKTIKKIKTKKENKQNPDKLDREVKQVSEFEKKELFDPTELKAKIDKAKIDSSKDKTKKTDEITQDQDRSVLTGKLTITEEQALQAQIFTCWSIPLGLPFNPGDMLVRIKLSLKPDGSIEDMEMLDHIKMNTPGKERFRTLADSVRRALQICNPLKVPASGYERWKKIIFNFNASEMLGG
jgi:hypothetical protein